MDRASGTRAGLEMRSTRRRRNRQFKAPERSAPRVGLSAKRCTRVFTISAVSVEWFNAAGAPNSALLRHRPAQRFTHLGRVDAGGHRALIKGVEERVCVLRGGGETGSAIGHG
jgi:hypothetical protein